MRCIIEVERPREGYAAVMFCNGMVRSRGGEWMPAQIYGLSFSEMFKPAFERGELGKNEHGYISFSDPSGIRIAVPDEWREATPSEIWVELQAEGRSCCWVEKVHAEPGTKIQMMDGSWKTI